MKITRNLFVVGALALTMSVFFSACGDSSNSSSGGSSSDIPIDGVMGELPALNAQWTAEAEEMLTKIEAETNDDKRSKLNQELDEWDKARKAKVEEVRKAMEGKEIPTEVQDGIPVQLEGNLKFAKTQGVPGYKMKNGVNIKVETTCKLTADLADMTNIANYKCVAYDADGKVIYLGNGFGTFEYIIDESLSIKENDKMRGKANAKYKVNIMIFCGKADFSRLAKIVIMDKTSEAYKQLEAQAKNGE